jgi:hypothetical protein
MALESSILSVIQSDLLVVPADKTYAITTILVCNYASTGTANFTMHLVKNGQARGNDNMIVNQLVLPAGETFTFDSEKIILEAGDFVSFTSNPDNGTGNSDLAATISYLEV